MQPSMNIRKKERGQSLVELAMTLTIMLLILAGIVDMARLALAYMVMRDAAQEGAAYGSMFPTSCGAIVSRVNDAAGGTFGPGAVNVSITTGGASCGAAGESQACGGKEIRVVVDQPAFPLSMPFIGTILGGQTIPLHVEITDTILRPACP